MKVHWLKTYEHRGFTWWGGVCGTGMYAPLTDVPRDVTCGLCLRALAARGAAKATPTHPSRGRARKRAVRGAAKAATATKRKGRR